MSVADWYFRTGLAVALFLNISASCSFSITCPCGSSNINYTHCVDEGMRDVLSCERWASCQTCEANKTDCVTCPLERFGRTCTEGLRDVQRQAYPYRLKDIYCGIQIHLEWYHIINCSLTDGGQICDITCKYGNKGRHFCAPGRPWIPPLPYCTFPTHCLDPGIPIGGKRMHADGCNDTQVRTFHTGESVFFSCQDEDSTLEGFHTIICQNGTWSDSLPHCEKSGLDCLDPGIPIGGKRMYEDGIVDSRAHAFQSGESTFFCCEDEDSILVGSHHITCQNGTWSDSLPHCEKSGLGTKDGFKWDWQRLRKRKTDIQNSAYPVMKTEKTFTCAKML